MNEFCLDCEALNELLRQKTGMGQGEIDSEVEDIKTQLRKKYFATKSRVKKEERVALVEKVFGRHSSKK